MPPRHLFTIGAVGEAALTTMRVLAGWNVQLTANGRDTMHVDILSPLGDYEPVLDDEILLHLLVPVLSSSVANPTVITTSMPHGRVTGDTVAFLSHSGSTPSINSTNYVATVISPTSFSIPVNVTVGGTGGDMYGRVFGGTVDPPSRMSGDGEGAGPAVLTSTDCQDFNAIAEHRHVNEVLPEGTLKSMLTILVANYLPTCTLHVDQVDGPTLGEQTFEEWPTLAEVLNALSTLSGGYVWDIDGYKRLSMVLPTTVDAPFDINNDVVGTPRITPSRNNYANRIILRFSAAPRAAIAYLIATAQPANNATVTIDGKVYTFQTTLTDVDGHVKIGATSKASLINLTRAINHLPEFSLMYGAGTNFAASTIAHPTVRAAQGTYFGSLTGMRVRAIVAGASGNSIAVTETSSNLYWRTTLGLDNNLADGTDQELTNFTMAEDEAEQAPPTGIWEKVAEAPDILDLASAEILAEALLTAAILVPTEIIYPTYGVGLRPGQVQTIVLDKYGINAQFLIIDVGIRHLEGDVVVYEVTAIEDTLLQAADRWRDYYKQLAGTGGGNVQVGAVSLSPPPAITITAPTIVFFGGDPDVWRGETASGDWKDANGIEVALDPALHGANHTVYVRIAARSGTVTARMRKKDGTPATVGTSSAVGSATLTTVAFSVTLTEAGTYGIQLSPSVTNEEFQMGSGYMEPNV